MGFPLMHSRHSASEHKIKATGKPVIEAAKGKGTHPLGECPLNKYIDQTGLLRQLLTFFELKFINYGQPSDSPVRLGCFFPRLGCSPGSACLYVP